MNASDKIRSALAGGKGLTSPQLQEATGEGPDVINPRIGAFVARGEAYAEPQSDGPAKYFLVDGYAPKRLGPAPSKSKAPTKRSAAKKPAKRAAKKPSTPRKAAAPETPPPPASIFAVGVTADRGLMVAGQPHGLRIFTPEQTLEIASAVFAHFEAA